MAHFAKPAAGSWTEHYADLGTAPISFEDSGQIRAFHHRGRHAMQSSCGGMAPPKDPTMAKPVERILRTVNFGLCDKSDVAGLQDCNTLEATQAAPV